MPTWFSGSIDASLNEIECRSHNLGQDPANELTIGPFSVLHFPFESQETMTAEMPIPGPHISLPESLGYMDEFLHWSDILDVEFDQTDFSAWPTSTMVDPCHFGQEDSNLFSLRVDELGFDLGGGDIRRHPLRTVKSKISAALSMDHSTAADRGEFVGPIARRHNGCALST